VRSDDAGPSSVDRLSANVIRGLAMDAIETSGGGHPGMPMGMADVATVLWTRFLRHNPADPAWPDRDRYVQSAGHGSTLLYAALHLSGYDLPLDQLKQHRALHSLTPGHPEYGRTPGVETTTGPLGQGFANAVGMALTERLLAARFNRPDFEVVDHFTYCIVGDGDLQEGIVHEAASLGGHLGLGKLICLFDDNETQIDGPTSAALSENTLARFEAYGWDVHRIDGHDMDATEAAIRRAQGIADRPSLIACRTTIGFGSPKLAGTAAAHYTTFGPEEMARTKAALGLPGDEPFWIPDEVRTHWRSAIETGRKVQDDWEELVGRYEAAYPDLADALRRVLAGGLPDGWDVDLPHWEVGETVPPRVASKSVLDVVVPRIGHLIGGSADLSSSTGAKASSAVAVRADDFTGSFIHYGIREHAMAGVMNGMALHGGVIPYGTTYLVFTDYLRASLRLAALMGIGVIHVWTHDSVYAAGVGPTHQAIEQLASLRAIPNLLTIRPADANETVAAWHYALSHRDRPVALVLAAHALPVLAVPEGAAARIDRGAYVLADDPEPQVILLATGSEVSVAMAARESLAGVGVRARVVNMPCWRLFEEQPEDYRESILPASVVARVSVEAASTFGWDRYVGPHGRMVGIDRFGECATSGDEVMAYLGITPEHVHEEALAALTAADS
jgi:transketolase